MRDYGAAKASHDDICDGALKHYETLANECHSWLSTIPKMIEFYRQYGDPGRVRLVRHNEKEKKMPIKNIGRSDIMNKKIVELNKRVQRLMYDAQLDGADLDDHHKEGVDNIDQALAYVQYVQTLLNESRA